MKGFIIGLLIAGLAVFVFLFVFTGRHNFKEPPFRIVLKDGSFQIREYESYAVVEVTVPGPFHRATSQSFSPLFQYISGGNLGRRNIEMTSPVLVEPVSEKIAMTIPVLVEPRGGWEEHNLPDLTSDGIESWTMAFVLPGGYTAETAPVPNDPHLAIRDVPLHRVATIRFNGRFTDRAAEKHRRRLESWLDSHELDHLGDWRIAAYDAPMTPPLLRRNEVLVTLV